MFMLLQSSAAKLTFNPLIGIVLALRGVTQPGSVPALGAGCREFESLHPDQKSDGLPGQKRARSSTG